MQYRFRFVNRNPPNSKCCSTRRRILLHFRGVLHLVFRFPHIVAEFHKLTYSFSFSGWCFQKGGEGLDKQIETVPKKRRKHNGIQTARRKRVSSLHRQRKRGSGSSVPYKKKLRSARLFPLLTSLDDAGQ